jgi:hypothetical protein
VAANYATFPPHPKIALDTEQLNLCKWNATLMIGFGSQRRSVGISER